MASFILAAEYNVLLIPLALSLPFVLTYLVTSLLASEVWLSRTKDRTPPLAPYWIPVLGHALAFFWDTSVVAKLTKKFQPGAVRLQFATTKINFVTGSDNIAAVWRSKGLNANVVTCFSLKNFFDTPDKAMKIYHADNTGINPQPHGTDSIPAKDRYYYLTRKVTVGFFNGPGLHHFANRFGALLTKQINQLDLGTDWLEHEDLHAFVRKLLVGPAIEAMCGPVLLEQSPTFTEDFWRFDSDMFYFFKGWPRWLAPRAWRNRARVLKSLKNWHAFARDNFDESCIEADGHDRFYGSPLMRSRQEYLPKIDSLDADALASQDLGLIWAENANSIPAVFWMILHALQRPDLLSQALDEVITSQCWPSHSSNPSTINVESLCNTPILQSMYAETLRVYTSLFALRSAAHGDFNLGNFTIPKDELIAVDTRVAAMDRSIWNVGGDGEAHPVDQFWAERFLVYPHDPKSGPLQFNPSRKAFAAPSTSAEKASLNPGNPSDGPQFTMDGLTGAWLPFGGGTRQCPGRNFAKLEIILSFAVIFSMLDIELLGDSASVGNVAARKPNMKYYGLGTLPPKGKVGFRMRRRV